MRSEHNSYPARFVHHSSRGFSFVETMLVVLVMVIVLGSVVRYVAVATQRSKVEQTRVDLTQEAAFGTASWTPPATFLPPVPAPAPYNVA